MLSLDGLLGMGEVPGRSSTVSRMEDLGKADVIVVIGANPTESAPVVGYEIKRGVRVRGAVLIVIDPFKIKLTKYAKLWINLKVNTDELLLLSFMSFMLGLKDLHKKPTDTVRKKIKDIEKKVKKLVIVDAEKKTGVSSESIKNAAALFLSAERRALVFGNGIAQQSGGAALVKMIFAVGSLAELLTKRKTTLFPLLYHSNALGSFHMGACMRKPEVIFS